MRFSERTIRLATSLLLPVAYFAMTYFFVTASVSLGETDRAIVWAEGSPSQLHAMARQVQSNNQFPDGRVSGPAARPTLPETCSAGSREFSLGSLRAEEAQAARALLESLASDVGASVCLTNVFIINELPTMAADRGWSFWSATLLQTMLLPLAMTLMVFLAFSNQLQLKLAAGPGISSATQAKAGALGATASLAAILALQGAGAVLGIDAPGLDGFKVETLGLALSFALVIAVPAMEEIAFRGWMLPLAEHALGTWPAVALTTAAFAASRMPVSMMDALLQLALGAIYATIYVRTRSLAACFLANAGFAALAFIPMGHS